MARKRKTTQPIPAIPGAPNMPRSLTIPQPYDDPIQTPTNRVGGGQHMRVPTDLSMADYQDIANRELARRGRAPLKVPQAAVPPVDLMNYSGPSRSPTMGGNSYAPTAPAPQRGPLLSLAGPQAPAAPAQPLDSITGKPLAPLAMPAPGATTQVYTGQQGVRPGSFSPMTGQQIESAFSGPMKRGQYAAYATPNPAAANLSLNQPPVAAPTAAPAPAPTGQATAQPAQPRAPYRDALSLSTEAVKSQRTRDLQAGRGAPAEQEQADYQRAWFNAEQLARVTPFQSPRERQAFIERMAGDNMNRQRQLRDAQTQNAQQLALEQEKSKGMVGAAEAARPQNKPLVLERTDVDPESGKVTKTQYLADPTSGEPLGGQPPQDAGPTPYQERSMQAYNAILGELSPSWYTKGDWRGLDDTAKMRMDAAWMGTGRPLSEAPHNQQTAQSAPTMTDSDLRMIAPEAGGDPNAGFVGTLQPPPAPQPQQAQPDKTATTAPEGTVHTYPSGNRAVVRNGRWVPLT